MILRVSPPMDLIGQGPLGRSSILVQQGAISHRQGEDNGFLGCGNGFLIAALLPEVLLGVVEPLHRL